MIKIIKIINVVNVVNEIRINIIKKIRYLINKVVIKVRSKIYFLKVGSGFYFITSNDYLPEPLTGDDEKRAIEKFEKEGSDAARNILVERNLRLVVYIAKKFENSGINIEDLISIGTVGLIKGINTFKSDKNIKLATYASKCIENEILMFIRKVTKTKYEISFDVPISGDQDGNELLLSDTIKTEEQEVYMDIEKETDKYLLEKLINKLSPREKEIISLRYGLNNEYTYNLFTQKRERIEEKLNSETPRECLRNYDDELTQKEVADYLGISQSYISRIEKKIMKRLKKELVKLY